jgi:hypothetical protein
MVILRQTTVDDHKLGFVLRGQLRVNHISTRFPKSSINHDLRLDSLSMGKKRRRVRQIHET